MILLQQHIELKIYHQNEMRKYKVIELLKDDEGMSFSIFHEGNLLFTLLPKMDEFLTFSVKDEYKLKNFNLGLYLKIEAALYSVFLKQPQS
jgi:hypothetical protein